MTSLGLEGMAVVTEVEEVDMDGVVAMGEVGGAEGVLGRGIETGLKLNAYVSDGYV